ncbi:hypothetical protein [Methyloglobulus sp.]|uniref:hypothetical protein n=1 Tax=Methyloglobulus sp. TaxID=2518622 RepID=UPI0032B71C82
MDDFSNTQHFVAAILLIARLGDIGTTYLVSPKLKLEANPIVRRFKWPFAILTIFLCLVPYWNIFAGIALIAAFLLVSASNSTKIFIAQTMGEEAYYNFFLELIGRAKPRVVSAWLILPAFFLSLLGYTILHFYPDPETDYGYWFGFGIIMYAIVYILYTSLAFFRLRKLVKNGSHNVK